MQPIALTKNFNLKFRKYAIQQEITPCKGNKLTVSETPCRGNKLTVSETPCRGNKPTAQGNALGKESREYSP